MRPSGDSGGPGAWLRRSAQAAWRRLPTWVVVALWRMRRVRTRRITGVTEDARTIFVQPGVELDVYWLQAPFGPAPAASLYVLGDEAMRLDCADGDRAHAHLSIAQAQLLSPGYTARLYFPPGPVAAHVERAAFEVEHNAPFAVATSLDPRLRRLRLDPERLRAAAAAMRAAMLELVERHGDEIRAGGGNEES